jgi:hypothetical protein
MNRIIDLAAVRSAGSDPRPDFSRYASAESRRFHERVTLRTGIC